MRKPVRLLAVMVDGQVLTPSEYSQLTGRPVTPERKR